MASHDRHRWRNLARSAIPTAPNALSSRHVCASLFPRVGELPRWLTPKGTLVLAPLEGRKAVGRGPKRTVTAASLTLGAVTDAESRLSASHSSIAD